MRINEPKSAEEIKAESNFPIWAPGIVDFEIRAAEETISKNGNDMIKLTVDVYNSEGKKQTIFDYLLESMAYKLRHCADACGLTAQYESGSLDAIEFEGKSGKCKINIQKDKSGQYPDKNGIADYLVDDAPKPALRSAPRAPVGAGAGSWMADMDDDIPFSPCMD
jgi:hypothetical protein